MFPSYDTLTHDLSRARPSSEITLTILFLSDSIQPSQESP